MNKKASENIVVYQNENGPKISTVQRNIIQENGKYYKDIDGSGTVSEINDWERTPKMRAESYVKQLSLEEKLPLLFVSDWRMGKYPVINIMDGSSNADVIRLDESGTLDEAEFHGRTIFGEQHLPGTTDWIKNWKNRHFIIRANAATEDLADYLNQLQYVAEECEHFIPVQAVSNSRNENGEAVFGMNDASGEFAAWPGTLGIAAAVRGSGIEIADEFADAIRRSWNAAGLRKGYMYMADVVSDPRWQRTNGTFGEDPELISEIMEHIIPRIQGSEEGVTDDGVALTIKHFPGGGARENGFDPHYKEGQWNVYQTEGSLEKYHLPAFRKAVACKAASIMPYYAKPSAEKSAVQRDQEGNILPMDSVGFAYNNYFIQKLLREQMGFTGYINSDTGIIHNMCWGVEELDVPERIAYAINEGGTDLISGLFDQEAAKEAVDRGLLTEDTINTAVERTLTELFALGMFENPFRDVTEAKKQVAAQQDWENAYKAHQKSVTLLKNRRNTLPFYEEADVKKVYLEAFAKDPKQAEKATGSIIEAYKMCMQKKNVILVDKPEEADTAILFLSPSSGGYFRATPGYLELAICENKTVYNTDELGRPTKETHLETTLSGADRIKSISDLVHKNGGKVIACVNISLAWQMGNVEPYVDALLAGYDTYVSAIFDVMSGKAKPEGKLPLTLPRNDEVLAVDEKGVCISPNDVPGYDKDIYIPDSLKDENGKAYAYRDAQNNYYEAGFGLSYYETAFC